MKELNLKKTHKNGSEGIGSGEKPTSSQENYFGQHYFGQHHLVSVSDFYRLEHTACVFIETLANTDGFDFSCFFLFK